MTKVLGLSDAQQTQIKAVFAAEREKSAPLMEKLAAYRQQLHDAAQAATFDEAAVRAIATNLAQAEIELTVARARAHNQINALLTTEQRALAEKLRPPMEERGPGHRPPFGGIE
jgi:Spy/CpxP family protein refolding chaperone